MVDMDNSVYMSFLPEYLRSNKDLRIFLKLLMSEFEISSENIENYPNIVNPDSVPKKFMESLGSCTDYRYVTNADEDFNRELLMRMQTIYEQRGTDYSIIMAATHGDNLGYVGGDIFIPGYEISKDKAELVVARDMIFTHNRSKHSGTDVFSDGNTFRPGVIIIKLSYINEDIVRRVIEVVPAGVKVKFFLDSILKDISFYSSFRVIPLTDDEKNKENSAINVKLNISIPLNPENFDIAIFSTNVNGRRLRSGRMVTTDETDIISELGTSMLSYMMLCEDFLDPEDLEEDGEDIPIIESYDELFRRSTHTGKYSTLLNKVSGKVEYVNDIADGTARYIISPSGEKLDILGKKGSIHLHRNIEGYMQEVDVSVFSEVRLTAIRSHNSGIRSGKGKMSGIITSVIDSRADIMEITPYDVMYYADRVKELKPNENRDISFPFNVEINDEESE